MIQNILIAYTLRQLYNIEDLIPSSDLQRKTEFFRSKNH
jgi:hypothetical protein